MNQDLPLDDNQKNIKKDNSNPKPSADSGFTSGQSSSSQNNFKKPAGSVGGGMDKERPFVGASEYKEAGVGEYKEPALPKETEGWMEKLEKGESISLPQPVTDDQGQVIMQDITQEEEKKVVLPMTEQEVKEGLHHKVFDSVRWLAEWCWRAVRMGSGKFVYRQARKDD